MTKEPKDGNRQIDCFRKIAMHLGCDENESAFRDKLRVIPKQKPKNEPSPDKRVSNAQK